MNKNSNLEIERKFLIPKIPFNLNGYEYKDIQQGYYVDENKKRFRIRKFGDKFVRTWKSEGDLVREEIEKEISENEFNLAWIKAKEYSLTKRRYFIPYQNHVIELDVFKEKFEGLIYAEIEFNSVEESRGFPIPTWFGKEVTSLKEYRNSSLAINGLPSNLI